jgi:UDP-N-acetylglucosamine--N-acetylmuramyl-(pentapeptide) pyrophosphoryl-undecaprenol N-acetylglucosamine transferase
MRIVLTGGGSGGHLMPLVAVTKKIKQKLGKDAEFLYIGSGAKMEKEVMAQEGIETKFVFAAKIRRYFSFLNFLDLFKFPIGIVQSLWILLIYMPDVIFSKGGFAAVPVVLAAWVYRIPVLIHESDSIPGMANKFLANFATRVAVAYPSAEEYFTVGRTALVGNPIREHLLKGNAVMFRKTLGFHDAKKTILVLGGSQGSQVINTSIMRILPQLLKFAQVIHQTGEKNFEDVSAYAADLGLKVGNNGREGYFVQKFLNEEMLADSYALADLVISRAGANSISEIAANGKPAILIPLDGAANDHQRLNAYKLAEISAAIVLEESNLGEHIFLEKIKMILEDQNLQNLMSTQIKTFYHPMAADIIANGVIEIGSI